MIRGILDLVAIGVLMGPALSAAQGLDALRPPAGDGSPIGALAPAFPPPREPPRPFEPRAPARAPMPRVSHGHEGFYLHLSTGFASAAMRSGASKGIDDGTLVAVAIGGAPIANLIVAGEIWATARAGLTLTGQPLASRSGPAFGPSGIGLNVTYYFMPMNVYVSAVPSLTTLSFDPRGNAGNTQPGRGLKLALGKEWWVSDSWGLGLNLQYAYSSNRYPGDDRARWTTSWYGVAFSATYN